MALWLMRAGKNGEYEQTFIDNHHFYITWDGLNLNLKTFENKEILQQKLSVIYPGEKSKTLKQWSSQLWRAAHEIKIGDWIVLPSKRRSSIFIGEVISPYKYDQTAEDPYFHYIDVKWIGENIPRQNFDQDLLYSFGAFTTICQISRNEAEQRLRNMKNNHWHSSNAFIINISSEDEPQESNVEELAHDQIIRLIDTKFQGHNFTRLVNEILKAKGYQTYMSPPGADGGIDILAARGEMGFGEPKLCIQVKSQDEPIAADEIRKLQGNMHDANISNGLFVSWSGYKRSVKEQDFFFSVRLWGKNELLEALFNVYDKLDPDLKAEIPLKKIWTLTLEE